MNSATLNPNSIDESATTYNGWRNFETWCVGLWLSNDEHTYRYIQQLIGDVDNIADAAKAIASYIEDANPLIDQASVFSDLLASALRVVDWREVAESFLDE